MFENLKAAGAKLLDNIKGKVKQVQENNKENKKLNDWISKFESDRQSMNVSFSLMDERELIYYGTDTVDANPNSHSNPDNARKKAANVQNITYEFIEACVDNTYPLPVVEAKRAASEPLARMIEDFIRGDLADVNMANLNDAQERTCPIQGYSIFEVYWDNTIKHHTYNGDINIRLVHPKQFVPQAGVWDVQKMERFFIMSPVTKPYIKRRYNKDVEKEGEQYPDINALADEGYSVSNSPNVTEIVCWYKDEDGDIGRFVWCNKVVLEDLPKIFKRRINGEIIEAADPIQSDYETKSGTKITDGTAIPYFTPDKYPIVVRRNVPVTFAFGGQSDVDRIRDQQDAIKKTMTKLQEKILQGGSILGLPISLKGVFKPSDKTLQVVWFNNPQEAQQFNVQNLQPDVSKDMAFLQQQYQVAQSTLGVTDVFQGKYDPSARSGLAKQIAIEQSMGRIKSKQMNKQQAYKELFEIMFMFKLAYCDEPRPYTRKDSSGKVLYEEFNPLEFLRLDADNKLYYETEFIFAANAGGGIPNDRMFMLDKASQMFQVGAYGNPAETQTLVRYWQVLENLHFPKASDIKQQLVGIVEAQQQLEQQVPPEVMEAIQQLPPEQQKDMLSDPIKIGQFMAIMAVDSGAFDEQGGQPSQPIQEQPIEQGY
jgi:hypothetical protein